MFKEWVTVQECMGLPGFPTTAPAMRKRLDDLSAGKEDLKRKRSGGKAFEYHVSVLPKYAQAIFAQAMPESNSEDDLNAYDADLLEVWVMIFKLLTPQQQKDCINLFKNRGLSALLPSIVNSSDDREIFGERDSIDNTSPAPSVSTQNKKAG